MDISKVSTADLVKELASRKGVKKISTGAYRSYELIKKYDADRESVSADTVLIVDHLDA